MRLSAVAALALGGALLGRATCQGVAGDACLVDLVERDENLLLQHQRSSLALLVNDVVMSSKTWRCIHLDSSGGLMGIFS